MRPDSRIPGLSFTAIDFETANPKHPSACAVGLAKVRDGQVVETRSHLISPPAGYDAFAPRNITIHGITPDRVAGAADWGEVYWQVMAFADGDPLIAHNASFDRSVLQQTCSVFDIDWPENPWYDTQQLSKQHLTLSSYSLPFVSDRLDLPAFEHHDAAADARQAALIAIAFAQVAGVSSLVDLAAAKGGSASSIGIRRLSGDFSSLEVGQALTGQSVVFTGALHTLKRSEANSLVESLGGVSQSGVTKKTTLVVTGDFDSRTFRPGAILSSKLEKAQKLAAAGQPIEILTEDDFLELIAVTRDELESATRAQRSPSMSVWLPNYVVPQAGALDPCLDYMTWLRLALRHPGGRATDGAVCVRCSGTIVGKVLWQFSERHVCSGDCNDALKRAAKRAWKKESIARPEAPSYESTYGRRRKEREVFAE